MSRVGNPLGRLQDVEPIASGLDSIPLMDWGRSGRIRPWTWTIFSLMRK